MTWITLDAVSALPHAKGPRITMTMRRGKRLPREMVFLTWADPPPWFTGGSMVSVHVGQDENEGSIRVSSGGNLRVTQMPCPKQVRIVSCGVRFYRWDSVPLGIGRSTVVDYQMDGDAVVITLPDWARPALAVQIEAPASLPPVPEATPATPESTMMWSPARIEALKREYELGTDVYRIKIILNQLPGQFISKPEVEEMIRDGELKRASPNNARDWTPERESYLAHHWSRGTTITDIQAGLGLLTGSSIVPIGAEITKKAREMGLARPKMLPV